MDRYRPLVNRVNAYLIVFLSGESQELDADFYRSDGADLVFSLAEVEVFRTKADRVASVTKGR